MDEVYTSRPSDRRTDVEEEIYGILERLSINFERVDHEQAETIEKCSEIEKILGAGVCKNLLLCNRQQTAFYMLLMPGNKAFKTKDLSSQINSSRLSFAPGDKMEELLRTSPGSLSILGLAFDKDKKVGLIIDKDVLQDAYIGVHPCKNTSTLKIKTKDITDKFVPFAGHEPVIVTL